MADTRDEDRPPLEDEDRLPWLEAVEEEDEQQGPSAVKMIAWVVVGLVGIGLLVTAVLWMGGRDGEANRDAELIAAPEGDYKVKPGDPGGMEVEGEGDTAFAASEGGDPKGSIDTGAVAETPVTKGVSEPKPQPQPQPKAPAAPSEKAPVTPAASGPAIQLGAFSSQAGANNAWKALSGRFSYLAPLTHSVTPVQSGGKTLYRLRASGPGSAGLCGRLRVAGESCVAID